MGRRGKRKTSLHWEGSQEKWGLARRTLVRPTVILNEEVNEDRGNELEVMLTWVDSRKNDKNSKPPRHEILLRHKTDVTMNSTLKVEKTAIVTTYRIDGAADIAGVLVIVNELVEGQQGKYDNEEQEYGNQYNSDPQKHCHSCFWKKAWRQGRPSTIRTQFTKDKDGMSFSWDKMHGIAKDVTSLWARWCQRRQQTVTWKIAPLPI